MSAVSARDGGDAIPAFVMLGWGTGQEIAASSLFATRIVCEEVLEEAWRCLACDQVPWLAVKTTERGGALPGAMTATASNGRRGVKLESPMQRQRLVMVGWARCGHDEGGEGEGRQVDSE
jgi:hypothetical protein